jgi:hypothetical protein
MATVSGSGKGINIIVGATYNDKDLARAERRLRSLRTEAKKSQGPIAQLAGGFRKQLTPSLMLAGAAAAAFAVKLGVDAVKAAAAEEAAVARLSQALENVGQTSALDSIESFIDSMARATGIADDSLRPAMITLVNATGDAAEAQSLLSLALDVSAGSGRDLSSVTTALAKAANGQTTALRRLGVPLSDAAVKSGDLRAISDELSRTFQGQANRAANTYEGRLRRLSVAFGELQESLGAGFLNALEGGEEGTQGLTDAMRDLEPVAEGLGTFVGEQVKGFADLTFVVGQAGQALGLFGDEADQTTAILDEHVAVLVDFALGVGGVLPMVSRLRGQMEDVGIISESVASQHKGYRDAVVRAGQSARDSVTYVSDLGDEVTMSGEDAEEAAQKFDLFAAAISKTEQVVEFRQAIADVGDAFRKTNTPVNIFGEKGEENFNLLKNLIERTASYSESQTTLAGKASVASQGLSTLADAFANTKMDAGTRALLLEPFQALIDDLAEAGVDVAGLQTQLNNLKNKTITVTVKTVTYGRPPGVPADEWYGAKGGMVPKYYAGGGMARGADTVPAMLAPGEFIMRRSAVQQFGADLFSQLNRGINPLAGMSPMGAGRGGGFQIGTINVVSAPGERAETSLPRALRRASFLAGVNG